ncbi:pheromone-regulated K(+) transporter PRM6 PWA37_001009 [Arxiozyma heterogenica]|uniref:pheromone-regulated K(+) transporter PRM6 n=1 Tax=Arxiozyma heterogenica TaxID=278026 RepID=UPI002F0B105B
MAEKVMGHLKDIFKLLFFNCDTEGWNHSQSLYKFDDLDLSLYAKKKYKKRFQYLIFIWGLTILKSIMIISDIYTCIKLLAFNIWSNNCVEPYVSFIITKWLFSVCILISLFLVVIDTVNGYQIYKTRIISLCFINNWSRNIFSLRSYAMFCLFDKITPSGFQQKLTFLTYFELKNCSKLLLVDTPRQIINGLTLWSVLLTKNEKNKNLKDFQSLIGIWNKVKWIVRNNHEEAMILSFMLLSFLIWLIFITKFWIAVLAFFRVYHVVVKRQKFNGLKEYICLTISYNIDYLTEKYKYKRFYSTMSLLETNKNVVEDFYETDSPFLTDSEDISCSIYENVMEKTLLGSDLSRMIFVKTPDSLNTLPSYYYHGNLDQKE